MSAAAELVVPATHDGQIVTRTLTDFREFLAIEQEWDRLVDAAGCDHPFLQHGWLRTWWTSFGAGRELQVVVAYRDGTLIAAAPLMSSRRRIVGVRARVLEAIANDHTPRYEFLVARGHEQAGFAALWRVLTDGSLEWDLLQLRSLRTDSATHAAVSECARRLQLPTGVWDAERSPYVTFRGTWDEYFKELSHNHRRNVGKSERRLERLGDLTLEMVTSPDEAALADGMRIEALAWKESAGTAMLSRADVQGFYEAFGRHAAEHGQLRLFFLNLDGRRIAFSYGLLYQNTIFVLKGGYDPEYSRYSPYHVLYSFVFQHGFKTGLSGYEFLGNDEPFKMKWTDTVRSHCWLYAFSRSPRARLIHWVKFSAIPRVRRILR